MRKFKPEAGPAGAEAVKQRFALLNRERLRRAQDVLRERQKDFLDLVPLFFHVNHPIIPGFVSKDTPVGISDYRPGKPVLKAAQRLAKSFDFKSRALPRYDIQAIYLMGSSGTVAYSKKSDFDIWVCHHSGIAPARLSELQQKCHLIEKWAAELDLEVHFFLIDPEHFKKGRHADLSTESSGTAQHYLLLEEFYRTGLLLAGRYPIWWLVPPERESDYEEYVGDLVHKRFVRENEFVDFGGVAQVPAEEFFGAALWQLFKGIDSPYKSVLKLLLMEIYANEYPAIDLLCLRFKHAIYDGETALDALDPYIMLYRKIEEYLETRDEPDRLDFVRRCFYFKVNEHMSAPDHPRHMNWRRELMREFMQAWGWGQVYLEMLDARPAWKINRVLRERKILVGELTHSYHFLSDFARSHAGLSTINQRDITVLGRKLYAAFERKAGKVEIINRGISDNLWEPHVSIHQLRTRDSQEGWAMYRGAITQDEAALHNPLKKVRGVCELAVWAYFNALVDERTAISLQVSGGDLSVREVQNILRALNRIFPLETALSTGIAHLERSATVVSSAVFVDVGLDPLRHHTQQGRYLTTGRTDPLNFSGLNENLAITFDQVILTSWKEVLTFRYEGVDGLFSCIGEYLQWAAAGEAPPPAQAFCYSSTRGTVIGKRIGELFADVIACYHGPAGSPHARYVVDVAQIHYMLHMVNGVVRYRRVGAVADLLQALALGVAEFSPVTIDKHTLRDTPLPAIFRLNRAGAIQAFFRADGDNADVYVVDENGSLFHQRLEMAERAALVNHLNLFFDKIRKRRAYDVLDTQSKDVAAGVEFFELIKEPEGVYRTVRLQPQSAREWRYFNVQVIGATAGGEKPMFTIYCNDAEFTTLEHGPELFSMVAAYILKQRRSGLRYPIYITDIDLPRALLAPETGGRVQTIHFLHYKRQIEQRLNEALRELDGAGP